jgi:hypothetical protein
LNSLAWLDESLERCALNIDFEQIVGANLTDPYLCWLGIDATLHPTRVAGRRLVIVGRDGLPLSLGPPGNAAVPGGVNLGTGRTNSGELAVADLPGGNGDPAAALGALPSLPGDGVSLPFPNQSPPDADTRH